MQRHRRYSEEWPACGMSWLTKAGTGCHEGGIILSKKPPEWRPVPAAARGQSRTPSPRRFPWPALGPFSRRNGIRLRFLSGKIARHPKDFYLCIIAAPARWSGTAEAPEVPEAPEAPEVPEAPEAPEVRKRRKYRKYRKHLKRRKYRKSRMIQDERTGELHTISAGGGTQKG